MGSLNRSQHASQGHFVPQRRETKCPTLFEGCWMTRTNPKDLQGEKKPSLFSHLTAPCFISAWPCVTVRSSMVLSIGVTKQSKPASI